MKLMYATWNFTSPGHGLCDGAVAQGKDVITAQSMLNIINSSSQNVKAFLVDESDMDKMDLNVKIQLQTVPNAHKIFQICWSQQDSKTLYMNYLSCSYCLYIGLYDQPCCHFPLHPNKWSFKEKKTVAKRKSVGTGKEIENRTRPKTKKSTTKQGKFSNNHKGKIKQTNAQKRKVKQKK